MKKQHLFSLFLACPSSAHAAVRRQEEPQAAAKPGHLHA